jgi:FkbM family methyltransferase
MIFLKTLAKNMTWKILRPFHNDDSWPMCVLSGPAKGVMLNLDIRVNGAYWIGNYDKWILDHLQLQRWLKPGGVAWDCGAYVGYYGSIFRTVVGSAGIVDVFEASAKNYTRLAGMPKINGWENVTIHHLAVGSDHAVIEFAGDLEGSSGPAGMSKDIPHNTKIERVQCSGVDELIHERGVNEPDFIKFDLETAEEFALHNGDALFSSKRPILLLELHGEVVLPAVASFLKKYDYQGWNILEFDDAKAQPLLDEHALRNRVTSNTIVCLPTERKRI